MDYERNSNCWYKDVCQKEDSCESCLRFLEMSTLLSESGIPKIRQYPPRLIPEDVDYDSFCELLDIKDNIYNLVNFENFNLYIASKYTGNGKTTWSIKLMLKYFDEIWAGNGLRVRGMFVHVPTLLMQLKNFENPLSTEYKNNLLNADMIIWDDIAHTDVSRYDYNNILMFIDNRLFNGKTNIYTSNIVSQIELEKCLGAKLASRIFETSDIVIFNGKGRRNG